MDGQRTDRQNRSLAGSERQGERRPALRQGGGRRGSARQGSLLAAGVAGSKVAAPIVARSGGGVLVRLKAEWAAIVGAELAAATWPEALGRDGALKIRVVSTFALDLQHRAPLVIERINRFFGRDSVKRLVLLQGRPPLATATARLPPAPPTAEDAAVLDTRLAGIADPELRAALAGLGRLVLAGKRSG